MKESTWVLLVVFLTIIFVISLWTIDISVSAMGWVSGGRVGNGFWTRDPVQSYHLGLWFAIGAWFSLSIVAVKSILRE